MTKHFRREEFACKCCGVVKVDDALLAAVDAVREHLGAPITILSGYRCEKHNQAVGGEKNSFHTKGLAADLWSKKSLAELYAAISKVEAFETGGIGIYPRNGFIHVDVRGKKARWSKFGSGYKSFEDGLRLIQVEDK